MRRETSSDDGDRSEEAGVFTVGVSLTLHTHLSHKPSAKHSHSSWGDTPAQGGRLISLNEILL